jgi:hypothetical protein
MSEPKQPPPANEDEARFDDEASAVGPPEPTETETTETGYEVPIPKRDDFFRNLIRAARGQRSGRP